MAKWSTMFRAAAVFNWLVGVPMLVATATMLAMLGIAAPDELTFHRLAALLIALFGAIYWMIAREPLRYRPLAALGVAGKLAVFALFAEAFAAARIPATAMGVAVGDLLFGLLFAAFLRATRGMAG